jgi:DNA-binding beta-propeller fold protein YncE
MMRRNKRDPRGETVGKGARLVLPVFLFLSVFASPRADGAGPFVLVTEWGEQGGAGIAKIDPATDQIIGRVANAGSPRHFTADPVRRIAYVSLHYGDKVAAVMPDTLEVAELDIPGLGKAPIGVSLTPDGLRLLVATRGDDGIPSSDDRLDVVSLSYAGWPPTGTLVQSIPTGIHPILAIVDHTGRYAVVTVRNEPAILVVDLTTYSVVWRAPALPADAEPEGGDAHPDESIVYVTLHGRNNIEVIDLDQMRITRHVPITNSTGAPARPSTVAFTPDGSRAYVSGQTIDRVLLFDTHDPGNPIQDTGVELAVGPQPHEIVWLPDDRGYVADTNNMQATGSLSVIHGFSGTPTVTGPILTDLAGPLSFAFFDALPQPVLAGLSCDSGLPGDTIVLSGGPFGAYQGTSAVTVSGVPAIVNGWTDGAISITLPPGISSGPVVVWVRGLPSNELFFAVSFPPPAAVLHLAAVKAAPEVMLRWQEVTTTVCGTPAAVASYRIYRGATPGSITTLAGTSAAAAYTTGDGDLADAADYYYLVRAVDAGGLEGP